MSECVHTWHDVTDRIDQERYSSGRLCSTCGRLEVIALGVVESVTCEVTIGDTPKVEG